MKKTILAAACVMALSTVVASAQSSQGNVGPGTNQAGSMGSGGAMNNNTGGNMGGGSGMSNSTTGNGGGMSNSETTGMNRGMERGMDRGTAANPSSQGNVGPGATPGNPGSSTNSR